MMRRTIEDYKIAEDMYGYDCPGTFTRTWVTNYNPPREPHYTLLERTGCLLAVELSKLPDVEKSRLPGGMVPIVIGISLHSEDDVASVKWRGRRTRGGRAFPLVNPSCSARPGRASIYRATPGGMLWDIVVCSDLVAQEAEARRIPYKEELVRYATHGMLHLSGAHHSNRKSAAEMFHRQEAFLRTALNRSPDRRGRMDIEETSKGPRN